MLCLLSGPPGFTCWISYALVFSFIYCRVLLSGIQFYLLSSIILHFISFLYLDSYVLGDDALIRKLGIFHANQSSMCLDPHLN